MHNLVFLINSRKFLSMRTTGVTPAVFLSPKVTEKFCRVPYPPIIFTPSLHVYLFRFEYELDDLVFPEETLIFMNKPIFHQDSCFFSLFDLLKIKETSTCLISNSFRLRIRVRITLRNII